MIFFNILLKGLFHVAVAYYLLTVFSIFMSIITGTHKMNKKYLGWVLSTAICIILLIISYISNKYVLVLIVLVLPFIIRKIFRG